jgi:hypothetical protein
MGHEDAGHYRLKHPDGTTSDPALAATLREKAVDARITCTAAHEVATACRVAPSEVGKTADLLELRLVECQMGLFGYSPEKKVVKPAVEVSEALRARLSEAAAGKAIDCRTCWEVAEALGIEKMTVSAACELLQIKIKSCQLGAF